MGSKLSAASRPRRSDSASVLTSESFTLLTIPWARRASEQAPPASEIQSGNGEPAWQVWERLAALPRAFTGYGKSPQLAGFNGTTSTR